MQLVAFEEQNYVGVFRMVVFGDSVVASCVAVDSGAAFATKRRAPRTARKNNL